MTTLELALDLEPNDDLATAAAMPIDTLIYDVLKTSIATLGMLSAGSDDIDTYIFTASQGVRIDVELCYDRHYPCGQGTLRSRHTAINDRCRRCTHRSPGPIRYAAGDDRKRLGERQSALDNSRRWRAVLRDRRGQ
jgi:hypothetical protein